MAVDLKKLLSGGKFLPIYASRKNSDRHSLGPVAVEFHWTSKCNYKCIHCSYSNRRQVKKELPDDIIRSVIDDLISLKTGGVYFKNKEGGLASIEGIIKGDWMEEYIDKLNKSDVKYAIYLKNLSPIIEAGLRRANVQSPVNRLRYEIKKWLW